jgi:hypothetical protein
MFWLIHFLWLWIRVIANAIAIVTWCCSLWTGCVYFMLWKSYDMLWVVAPEVSNGTKISSRPVPSREISNHPVPSRPEV